MPMEGRTDLYFFLTRFFGESQNKWFPLQFVCSGRKQHIHKVNNAPHKMTTMSTTGDKLSNDSTDYSFFSKKQPSGRPHLILIWQWRLSLPHCTCFKITLAPMSRASSATKHVPNINFQISLWAQSTTPEKFEKGRFYSERAKNVFVHTTPEEFENETITGHFGFALSWKKLGQGNHVIIVTSSFPKTLVFKMFSVHTKTKIWRFQIPPVWKAFSKSSVFVTD